MNFSFTNLFSFSDLLKKYLLNTYNISGTIIGERCTAVNKELKIPALMVLTFYCRKSFMFFKPNLLFFLIKITSKHLGFLIICIGF